MGKTRKFLGFLVLLAIVVYAGTLLSDKAALGDNLVRLHVVAASDSEKDQAIKLQVRDAVLEFMDVGLEGLKDIDEVTAYIRAQLPQIQAVANETLEKLGVDCEAVVTFLEEEFPTRIYDTFSLPAGVYESLKITIGEGEGENWWCVVFPSLCMQASTKDTADAAVGAGFSGPLADTLTGESGYEVRFFFLEVLGKIENFFHRG